MTEKTRDPLFGAAVLKLSFILKGQANQPGFRVVYFGTLNELGITNTEVDDYIRENRARLEEHIKKAEQKG